MARAGAQARPLARGIPAPIRLRDLLQRHALALAITALLLWIVGAPILFLLVSSLRTGNPVNPGPFTLGNYWAVYTSPLTWPALLNTALYAGCASVVGLSVACAFAWLIERTDMPGRDWAWTIMLLPLAMPGTLASMAWILLLSPRSGILNLPLRALLEPLGVSLVDGPLNIFSLPGMIFIESLRGSTTLFLMMVGAFRLMDPALEEAAAVSGANTREVFRKITLRLVLPALMAAGMYSFLGTLEDFETPLLIGLPANVYVLPTLIYFSAYGTSTPQFGLAAAYTSLFLIITVALVVVYYRFILRRAERFVSVSGKGFRPRRIQLGPWRFVAAAVFGLYAFLTVGLPLIVLVWASLLPGYQPPSVEILQHLTLANYATMISDPAVRDSILNTVVLASSTATGTMVVAVLVSWLVVRQRVRGGAALDALAFIPHAIPSVAIGMALVIFYLSPAVRWVGIYGTIWIMTFALMTRYLAFATRTSNAAMTQIGRELEDAGYTSGVGKLIVLLRITTPLLLPSILAGWLWVAAHSFRSLTIPLMLAGPDTQTITTALFNYWGRKGDFALASALGVALILSMGAVIFLSRRMIVRGYTQ